MTLLNRFKPFLTTASMTGAALLALSAAPASAQTGDMLTPAQAASDIKLLKEAYERIHPGYTRYATRAEMDAGWADLAARAEINDGISTGDFYIGIQSVLTRIRCDHTKAELPKSLIEARKINPVYLPFRWSVVEGRGLIRVPGEGTDLGYGDEILSIDGRPLTELIADVSTLIPVDGYTEWSRTGGISESLEFRGGAVDHFGAILWDIAPEAALEIETPDGTRKSLIVPRISFENWSDLGKASGVTRDFKDAVRFENTSQNAAYLAIDTFVNYRNPVDPDTVYDPIFDKLAEDGTEFLILDLRENGGGSSDAQNGLLNRLANRAKAFSRDVRVNTLNLDGLRQHLWTWDQSAMNPNKLAFKKNDDGTYSFRKFAGQHGKIKPTKNAFKGRLLVLTSHSNSSGSAALLAHLKDMKRATFIGEEAGGSAEGPTAGLLFTLTLPESGIKTRIPAIRYYHNISSFEPGLSTSPDIYARMTVEDFREKRDPALEAAIALINNK